MNLLFFTQIFYPFVFGGGEYVFFSLTKELARRGHAVHVITQRLRDTQPFEVVDGIKIYRIGQQIDYRGTLPPTIGHNLNYLISAFRRGRELIKLARRNGQAIDVIHSNTYVPVLCGQLCSWVHKIPHVITFHDVYQASDKKFWTEWISKQNDNLPFYASAMSKLVEKVILKLPVSAIHTVSETSRDDLISFGISDSKITVIPNGLDQSLYGQSHLNTSTPEENVAVYIGRLVFYKNVETVIRAFKNVVKVIPEARLLIVGDGPSRNTLVKEAEGTSTNIIFTGRVSAIEKAKIINASSFIVFPSLVEGFGIAIIEGFACQKPVLVSDVPPLSHIVRNGYTGYVIPPFDTDYWTKKIVELFSDKTKRQEMGKNAFQDFLSKYQLRDVVSKIEMLYHTVKNMK